ncbi:MAG: cell division transport system permease protein [Clostridiales bacterium]|nr:cell division transport system permease protein [Clostridiales bacterium]
MSSISTLFYSIKQGVKNLYRNRRFTLASVGTITACIFMFGIFYFIISNFQLMVHTAEGKVGITVFFKEGITDDDIAVLKNEIAAKPEVLEITYTSAEEAWEKFRAEMFKGEENLAESFGEDNPLADSASFEIKLKDVSKQDDFVRYLDSLDGIRQVNSSNGTAKILTNFNMLVGYISGAIIIILLSVAIFLISTTITMGISVRKDEIAIMRLIGATDFFIRAPFVVEGIVIGFIGALIPLGILYAIYNYVIAYITSRFYILSDMLTFLSVQAVFKTLLPISLLIGIGIGFFGSFTTVRKHLKV